MDVMILKLVNDSTWVLLNGSTIVARNTENPNRHFDWKILVNLSNLDKEVLQYHCAEMYNSQSIIKEIINGK